MKRFLSIAVAASLALGSVAVTPAAAQPYNAPPGFYHEPGYLPPGYHRAPDHDWNGWHRGGYYRGPRYVVRDYGRYHLRRPPRGYEWIQANGQFVLLAVTTGVIADILLSH